MVPRENKNNTYAKFGGTNKEYYGIFRSGLYNRCVIIMQISGGVYSGDKLSRGYYMAARGYEFYLRVLKVSLTSERSERVRDTLM